jgi:hypothetical protein
VEAQCFDVGEGEARDATIRTRCSQRQRDGKIIDARKSAAYLAPSRERHVRLLPDPDKNPQSYEGAKGIVAKVADAVRGILDSVEETVDIKTLIPLRQMSAPNEPSAIQLGSIDTYKVPAGLAPKP